MLALDPKGSSRRAGPEAEELPPPPHRALAPWARSPYLLEKGGTPVCRCVGGATLRSGASSGPT